MILLDTNYLIRILVRNSAEFDRVAAWVRDGEPLGTSSICWYEFCCGPVGEKEQGLLLALLSAGVLAFREDDARRAADLFNSIGRVRSLRVDCLVAAASIEAGSLLATSNLRDFEPFVPLGLKLA